ncbi:MAG: DNA-processing protein DprA [Patescibacteria group bacterium]
MSRTEKEREFYFSFAYCDIFGVKRIIEIQEKFGSLEKAWLADKNMWTGLKNSIIEKFFNYKKSFSYQKTTDYLSESDINFLLFDDTKYPTNLKNISNPPPIIFYLGDISIAEKQRDYSLAIVGSRLTSTYGEKVLNDLMEGLDERFLIISGLAFGTDAHAHQKALEMNLKTGAVLGGPLEKNEISCPTSNYWLAKEIVKHGGFVLTEFPPHSQVQKSNFPRRNRIIAGLSRGTLVIEAGKKSGAIKTAEYARDADRVVMAVPGSIFNDLSVGTNSLLKDHVDAVSEPQDIYCYLGIKNIYKTNKDSEKRISDIAIKVAGEDGLKIVESLILLNKIGNTDEISAICQLDTPRVHSTLTILELSGIIKKNGSGQFILS